MMAIEDQQAVESGLVKRPVPHRPAIDVNETRMRVPPDAAALHRPGGIHRHGDFRVEPQVERAAQDVLTVLGHSEGGACEHRVGLGRPIGRKDRRAGLADRVQNIGQKVDHTDIHLRLFTRVMIAQKDAELFHHPVDRAVIVAVGALERLAGIGVGEAKTAQLGRARNGARRRWPCRQPAARERK